MELLQFGHAGRPVLVFPTSEGRFYEFEDHGMVWSLSGKIERGELQLFCLDSIDSESWYSRRLPPAERIARHMLYEEYVLREVLPLIRRSNPDEWLTAAGCSFGGYHSVNLALRHPELVRGFLSLSGAFDIAYFLSGYYDENLYFHQPTHFLPRLTDERVLAAMRANRYVLATGWDDKCLEQNRNISRILTEKGIAHELHIWQAENAHDWPTWQRMVAEYL